MNGWPNSIPPTSPTSWKTWLPISAKRCSKRWTRALPPARWKSLNQVSKSVVESLDSDRAADIVEEMEPDAAADLLGDLSDERSEEIGADAARRAPGSHRTAEFNENTAAGRMTTEYIALPVTATANKAIEAMRSFEGRMENMSTIYLTDFHGTLAGAVPRS